MTAPLIRHLLDADLTTINELEEITGRSTSTIYRWLNGESEPLFQDMRQIVRGLAKPEARRTLVGLLTSDLPVLINWLDDDPPATGADDGANDHDADDDEKPSPEILSRSLLALTCLTEVLSEEHAVAAADAHPTPESLRQLIARLDDTMRHLAASRRLVARLLDAGARNDT